MPSRTTHDARHHTTSRRQPLVPSPGPILRRFGIGFGLCLGLGCGTAHGEWVRLALQPPSAGQHRYIDLDTVRQTGPMSIYRRVQELSQPEPGTELSRGASPASVIQTVEYDCMSGKRRVIQETGFRQRWGQGDPVSPPDPLVRPGDWQDAAGHPGGATVLAMVCPGEPGS